MTADSASLVYASKQLHPSVMMGFKFPTAPERSSSICPLSVERAVNLPLQGPAAHQRLMRPAQETPRRAPPAAVQLHLRAAGLQV